MGFRRVAHPACGFSHWISFVRLLAVLALVPSDPAYPLVLQDFRHRRSPPASGTFGVLVEEVPPAVHLQLVEFHDESQVDV